MTFCLVFYRPNPFEKGLTLKGKNLGANSFLFKWTPFQKGGKTILKIVSP